MKNSQAAALEIQHWDDNLVVNHPTPQARNEFSKTDFAVAYAEEIGIEPADDIDHADQNSKGGTLDSWFSVEKSRKARSRRKIWHQSPHDTGAFSVKLRYRCPADLSSKPLVDTGNL
jgi:hypothetical protein